MEAHRRSSVDDARALEAGIANALPGSPLQPPPAGSYPPISSIPQTSHSRLYRPEGPDSPTVLYLAYGSNLAASKFLGARGVRPVSRVNVSAPTLDLTFDVSGVPYSEPCFANTAIRKVPEKPPAPPRLPNPLDPSPLPDPPPEDGRHRRPGDKAAWGKGLIGAVYEVNREEYNEIYQSEDVSYVEIMVPCFPLPVRYPGPGNPELPKPFFARTLCMPLVPESDDGDDDGLGDDAKKKPWYLRWITLHLRSTGQPSSRYLELLKTGAREHDLPADWQAYLASLKSYTRTSRRQEIGNRLWWIMLLIIILYTKWLIKLSRLLRRLRGLPDDGRPPQWLKIIDLLFRNVAWAMYDGWGKHLFGDGEKTEDEPREKDVETNGRRWQEYCRQRSQIRGDGDMYPDEKVGLMS